MHVTSRTVGQVFLFGEVEKRVFVKMMRQWADFSGLSVITHCLMDNHFHMMLWVPARVEIDHRGILESLERVWPEEKVVAWEKYYQAQGADTRASMDAVVVERMADLPEFMRVLKQSFTCWYNRTHGRKGVLWDMRYRSVVVEDSPLALMSVASYIDLNPLRAGMVENPLEYAWSGYGAAMGGDKHARRGLNVLVHLARGFLPQAALRVRKRQLASNMSDWREIAQEMSAEQSQRAGPRNWKEVQAAYRIWLVNKGESKLTVVDAKEKFRQRKGLDPVQVIAEYEKWGTVPLRERLLVRKRAYSRGVALGRSEFLEELMREYRSCFGPKRKKAARRVKGLAGDCMCLRQVEDDEPNGH